jgi:hypothetical protein
LLVVVVLVVVEQMNQMEAVEEAVVFWQELLQTLVLAHTALWLVAEAPKGQIRVAVVETAPLIL